MHTQSQMHTYYMQTHTHIHTFTHTHTHTHTHSDTSGADHIILKGGFPNFFSGTDHGLGTVGFP